MPIRDAFHAPSDRMAGMESDSDERLRDAIRQGRLSIDEIAERSGVSKETILQFLAGREIRLGAARKLATCAYSEANRKPPEIKPSW